MTMPCTRLVASNVLFLLLLGSRWRVEPRPFHGGLNEIFLRKSLSCLLASNEFKKGPAYVKVGT